MYNRRKFLKTGGIVAAGSILGLPHLLKASSVENGLWSTLKDIPTDKPIWDWVRNSYSVSEEIANFNNGAVSPQPKVVQDVFEKNYREFNKIPSMHMWSKADAMYSVREQIAKLAGCSADEIAINRNTTEAINTVIWGLNHEKGDEVILCEQDYNTVMNSWEEKEARFGIVLKWISFDLPLENKEKIVRAYTNAITSRTKTVMITHVNNLNGNIMPVKEITAAVKAINSNIKVIVDGAHSFAHINFSISDIGCDFFGSSLHKWLGAPFGTGFLYVKKREIKELWPLFTHLNPKSDDISKFETVGVNMLPAELAIACAVDFHNAIGIERKEKRLRFLKDYWITRVKDLPNVEIKTSIKPEFACALGSFSLKNMNDGEVRSLLYNDYKIHLTSKADKNNKYHGVRVTPHVYTKIEELDRLIKGIIELAKQ